MLYDPILKKNLLKSVVAGLVNIAQDLHKKCSCQHKCKRVCIQTNTKKTSYDVQLIEYFKI